MTTTFELLDIELPNPQFFDDADLTSNLGLADMDIETLDHKQDLLWQSIADTQADTNADSHKSLCHISDCKAAIQAIKCELDSRNYQPTDSKPHNLRVQPKAADTDSIQVSVKQHLND